MARRSIPLLTLPFTISASPAGAACSICPPGAARGAPAEALTSACCSVAPFDVVRQPLHALLPWLRGTAAFIEAKRGIGSPRVAAAGSRRGRGRTRRRRRRGRSDALISSNACIFSPPFRSGHWRDRHFLFEGGSRAYRSADSTPRPAGRRCQPPLVGHRDEFLSPCAAIVARDRQPSEFDDFGA